MRSFSKRAALTLLILFIGACPLFGQNREDLFKQAFGFSPPKKETPFLVKVIVDGYYVGEMEIKVNSLTSEILFPPSRMKILLETILTDDALKELDQFILKPMIPDPSLLALGYKLEFNQRDLSIDLETPPTKRRSKEISVSSKQTTRYEIRSTPQYTPFSGYINVRGSTTAEQLDSLWDPMQVNLESVLSIQRLTYRNFGNFTSAGRGEFDFHQFLHDDPERFIRYTLGDLFAEDVGMMNGFPMVGLRVQKQEQYFNVTPFRNTFIYELFLEAPSNLVIYVNNELRANKELPAGFVTLSDFPLDFGRNDVQIDVVVSKNIIKTYQTVTVYDEVLDTRIPYRYMVAAGVDQNNGNLFRSEGYYLKRNSPMSAAGPLYQVSNETFMIGERIRQLFVFGSLDTDLGAFLAEKDTVSLGAGLQLSSYAITFGKDSQLRYSLSLRNFGRDFVSRYSNNGERAWFLSPSVFLNLSTQVSLSFNSYYVQNHDGNTTLDFSTILGWRFTRGAYQLNYRTFDGIDGQKSWEITNRFNLFLRQDSFRVSKQNNNENTTITSLNWNRRPVGDSFRRYSANLDYIDENSMSYSAAYSGRNTSAEVTMDQNEGYWNYAESLQYENHRGRAQLRNTQLSNAQNNTNSTSFSFSTGVAFVGRNWGITHDLNQSFALVYPEKELQKYHFTVDGNRTTDWLGGVVVPNVPSYIESGITIIDSDVPIGTALETRQFKVTPASFTGVGVEIMAQIGVVLKGRLEDTEGNPLARYTGTMVSEDTPDSSPILFFTNAKGLFMLDQIKPGKYTLSLPGADYDNVTITIIEEKSGIVNIGSIRMELKPYNRRNK